MINYDAIRPRPELYPGQSAEDTERSTALMDEAAASASRYQALDEEQITAEILYAMSTHALDVLDSCGRMLWVGDPETGKTTSMKITGALSANARNVTGTTPAVRSLLAAAALEPETPMPALMVDQVDKYYGGSGMNVGATIINDIMREGYVSDAVMSWSANRKPVTFSIFCAVLMTGSDTPLPYDIKTRTITIHTRAGEPEKYFDARHARREMKRLGASLGEAVRKMLPQIAAFETEGIHPKLVNRLNEVWGPLFAIAAVLGGQKWLNRCHAAFEAMALGNTRQILSPRQQMFSYAAELITSGSLAWAGEAGFVPGKLLASELLATGEPLYAGRTQAGMEKLLGETLDIRTVQQDTLQKTRSPRYPAMRMRGYFADAILAEWERIRPAAPANVVLPKITGPFDIEEEAPSGTSGTSGKRKVQPRKVLPGGKMHAATTALLILSASASVACILLPAIFTWLLSRKALPAEAEAPSGILLVTEDGDEIEYDALRDSSRDEGDYHLWIAVPRGSFPLPSSGNVTVEHWPVDAIIEFRLPGGYMQVRQLDSSQSVKP